MSRWNYETLVWTWEGPGTVEVRVEMPVKWLPATRLDPMECDEGPVTVIVTARGKTTTRDYSELSPKHQQLIDALMDTDPTSEVR